MTTLTPEQMDEITVQQMLIEANQRHLQRPTNHTPHAETVIVYRIKPPHDPITATLNPPTHTAKKNTHHITQTGFIFEGNPQTQPKLSVNWEHSTTGISRTAGIPRPDLPAISYTRIGIQDRNTKAGIVTGILASNPLEPFNKYLPQTVDPIPTAIQHLNINGPDSARDLALQVGFVSDEKGLLTRQLELPSPLQI